MRVSVETTNGLERKATVTVPSESFEEQVSERLKTAANELKLPGFRPGKVPLKEVRRRFGQQLRREVASELLQSSFADAVREEELSLAGQARVEIVALEAGEDLQYVATFEVMPDIDLAALDALDIRRPTATIEEADIDATVLSMREQRTEWELVTRPAATSDRATVDYAIKVDGETVDEREGATFVVGDAATYSELDSAVVGMTAAETRAFPIAWRRSVPAEHDEHGHGDDHDHHDHDHHEHDHDHDRHDHSHEHHDHAGEHDHEDAASRDEGIDEARDEAIDEARDEAIDAEAMKADAANRELADGDAETLTGDDETSDQPSAEADDEPPERQGIGEVTLRSLEEPHLPEVDDAFFDWFGVEQGEDRPAKFRAAVRERMQLELEQATRRAMQLEVTRVLAEAHDFALPEAMVEAQMEGRIARWRQLLPKAPEEMLREMVRTDAERDVRASLVMREIASQQAMTPDDERIQSRVDEIAGGYEEAAEVRRWIYGDEDQLGRIESAVLEDQVVEHVLTQAHVTTVSATYQDVIRGRALPELLDENDEDDETVIEALDEEQELAAPGDASATGDDEAPDQEDSLEPEPMARQTDVAAQAMPEPRPDGLTGRLRRLFGKKT